jgi:hypothetical protein
VFTARITGSFMIDLHEESFFFYGNIQMAAASDVAATT